MNVNPDIAKGVQNILNKHKVTQFDRIQSQQLTAADLTRDVDDMPSCIGDVLKYIDENSPNDRFFSADLDRFAGDSLSDVKIEGTKAEGSYKTLVHPWPETKKAKFTLINNLWFVNLSEMMDAV